MLGRLNHVALAVPDIAAATVLYRDTLGGRVSAPQALPEHGVTVVFVDVGNTKVELLEPLGEGSPIRAFLDKNPLGGIRGAAQLLARELIEPSLQDYTDVIIQEADRLRNLVDRMLGPYQPPRLTRINIHEVTEHVCSLIQAETLGNLEIHRDYDPSIPDLMADREQLIQAVLNIVRNAAQASAAFVA